MFAVAGCRFGALCGCRAQLHSTYLQFRSETCLTSAY
jgi:hypothetical protein